MTVGIINILNICFFKIEKFEGNSLFLPQKENTETVYNIYRTTLGNTLSRLLFANVKETWENITQNALNFEIVISKWDQIYPWTNDFS